MHLKYLAATFAVLVSATGVSMANPTTHWRYSGAEGQAHWADVSPDYAICGTGAAQSPVDLVAAQPFDAADADIHWRRDATWQLVNNGHTIEVKSADAGYILVGGTRYDLLQFHFHAPSEHTIDGTRFAMEAHFVHRADTGALAVIGVMLVGGGENTTFDSLMGVAPVVAADAGVPVSGTDPYELMPADVGFYRYQGSLTTPPCSEIVLWTVMTQPISVSQTAVDAFTALYSMNARVVQPLNGRFLAVDN